MSLKFQMLTPSPVSLSCPAACQSRIELPTTSPVPCLYACHHAFHHDSNELKANPSYMFFFIRVVMVMVSLQSEISPNEDTTLK